MTSALKCTCEICCVEGQEIPVIVIVIKCKCGHFREARRGIDSEVLREVLPEDRDIFFWKGKKIHVQL